MDWSSSLCTVQFKNAYHNPDHTALNPSFKIDCSLFDVTKKKSKDYYSLFVRKKACFPNNARKLKCEFNLTDWWGTEKSFFSSPFGCFWAICQGLSVQNIELYTPHEFQITQNRVHCRLSMFFLQTWIRNNAAFLLWLLLINFFLERFRIVLLIFDKTADTS